MSLLFTSLLFAQTNRTASYIRVKFDVLNLTGRGQEDSITNTKLESLFKKPTELSQVTVSESHFYKLLCLEICANALLSVQIK